MLALAATSLNAQDFTASPADGATITASELQTITLTWPEGTAVSIDEWSAYMEIKTLESYEADMNDDIYWEYVGYAFSDTWTVEGSTVTVHPDYMDITEDGTYVVYIVDYSFNINGEPSGPIVLKYNVVADGVPAIDLTAQKNLHEGKIAIVIPEGYTLSSVADDMTAVVTDGEDYVCDATYAGTEDNLLLLAPAAELEPGRYYVSVNKGSFLFNEDTLTNAYLYASFTVDNTVAISQLAEQSESAAYNLMGQRTHHIGTGLHVVNGKVIVK